MIHELVSAAAPGLGAAAGWVRWATTSRGTSSSAGGQYFDPHRFSHFIVACMTKTRRKQNSRHFLFPPFFVLHDNPRVLNHVVEMWRVSMDLFL